MLKMPKMIAVLVSTFTVIGCAQTTQKNSTSQLQVLPARVTSVRVLLEHPVAGWRGSRDPKAVSQFSAVYFHETHDAEVFISLHELAGPTPADLCEAMQRTMAQNGRTVSAFRDTKYGGGCIFTFRYQKDGRKIRGEFTVSIVRHKYLLLIIGHWPEENHESLFRDYETIKGSVVLLER